MESESGEEKNDGKFWRRKIHISKLKEEEEEEKKILEKFAKKKKNLKINSRTWFKFILFINSTELKIWARPNAGANIIVIYW